VTWVDIDTPNPDLEAGAPGCFAQGRAKGGAAFNRLEGIQLAEDGRSIYFVSTSGGERKYGQLWHYIPADGQYTFEDQLVLVFESPDGSVLDSPDNLSVTPRGGILFQEDDASAPDNDTHPLAPELANINRLIGLGTLGEPFEFAVNMLNDSEFAGACWSPDGDILFVNLFGDQNPNSGMTCAIWGPWGAARFRQFPAGLCAGGPCPGHPARRASGAPLIALAADFNLAGADNARSGRRLTATMRMLAGPAVGSAGF
jgi:uncharacterized protein